MGMLMTSDVKNLLKAIGELGFELLRFAGALILVFHMAKDLLTSF